MQPLAAHCEATSKASCNKHLLLFATVRHVSLFVAMLVVLQRCFTILMWCRQGARFTKWRAALKVSDTLPSKDAIERNARDLASYAVISQVLQATPPSQQLFAAVLSQSQTKRSYFCSCELLCLGLCLCVKHSMLGDVTVPEILRTAWPKGCTLLFAVPIIFLSCHWQGCQLVPIVEPELLIDSSHVMDRFAEASYWAICCCAEPIDKIVYNVARSLSRTNCHALMMCLFNRRGVSWCQLWN